MATDDPTARRVLPLIDDVAGVVGGIRPEQATLPTPCAEFDVAALQRHLLGWLEMFRVALTDPEGQERPDPAAHEGPADPKAAAGEIERFAETVRASLADGVERRTVNVPNLGGAYPGSAVIGMLTAELLGHGWDLAKATGQAWRPDPAVCTEALAAIEAAVKPEYRGPGMPFGPQVDVPGDASPLDRFVAFTGRSPGWVASAGA